MLNMPKDFKKTVEDLKQHLTDDEVKYILSSPDYMTGNQRIIMFLIKQLKHGEELFKLFDILESIKDSPNLAIHIDALRKGGLL